MKSVFLGVIFFIVGLLGWASVRLGFFKEVVIEEQQREEMQFVYLVHTGPYHKIIEALEKVEAWAKTNNVDCKKSFGHFLDDPDIVEHERLQSHVGCIVDKAWTDLPPDFKYKVVPQSKYLVAEFLGSPAIGPMKVYGKAKKAFYQRDLIPPEDVMEIYDRIDEKTLKTSYLFRMK